MPIVTFCWLKKRQSKRRSKSKSTAESRLAWIMCKPVRIVSGICNAQVLEAPKLVQSLSLGCRICVTRSHHFRPLESEPNSGASGARGKQATSCVQFGLQLSYSHSLKLHQLRHYQWPVKYMLGQANRSSELLTGRQGYSQRWCQRVDYISRCRLKWNIATMSLEQSSKQNLNYYWMNS